MRCQKKWESCDEDTVGSGDGFVTTAPYLPLSLARASISSKKTMEGATALAFRNTCERSGERGKRLTSQRASLHTEAEPSW